MEYTLLSLLAPGPASSAELKQAVADRSCAVVFRRYVKNDTRALARNVLPALDPAKVDFEIERLLGAGLIAREDHAPFDATDGLGGTAGHWYAITAAGREQFLGWIFRVWPIDPYEIPAMVKATK